MGRFLDGAFPEAPLTLPGPAQRSLVTDELPGAGILGGAVSDALIAATVRAAADTLVTLDTRARLTCQRIVCDVDFLG